MKINVSWKCKLILMKIAMICTRLVLMTFSINECVSYVNSKTSFLLTRKFYIIVIMIIILADEIIYQIITSKNKKVNTLLCEVKNANGIFHQLVKNWRLWNSFLLKIKIIQKLKLDRLLFRWENTSKHLKNVSNLMARL